MTPWRGWLQQYENILRLRTYLFWIKYTKSIHRGKGLHRNVIRSINKFYFFILISNTFSSTKIKCPIFKINNYWAAIPEGQAGTTNFQSGCGSKLQNCHWNLNGVPRIKMISLPFLQCSIVRWSAVCPSSASGVVDSSRFMTKMFKSLITGIFQ